MSIHCMICNWRLRDDFPAYTHIWYAPIFLCPACIVSLRQGNFIKEKDVINQQTEEVLVEAAEYFENESLEWQLVERRADSPASHEIARFDRLAKAVRAALSIPMNQEKSISSSGETSISENHLIYYEWSDEGGGWWHCSCGAGINHPSMTYEQIQAGIKVHRANTKVRQ